MSKNETKDTKPKTSPLRPKIVTNDAKDEASTFKAEKKG